MANPNVSQGALNRLRASIIWPLFPALNITPSFLMPEAIKFSPQGPTNVNLRTMTGLVRSPEPYVPVMMEIHLIKSQALADAFKAQIETDVFLGDATVRPDAVTLSPFIVGNCSIVSAPNLDFSGKDAGFVISVEGAWNVNANLWL